MAAGVVANVRSIGFDSLVSCEASSSVHVKGLEDGCTGESNCKKTFNLGIDTVGSNEASTLVSHSVRRPFSGLQNWTENPS